MSGTVKSRSVAYDRQTIKHPNPFARFAHIVRHKTALHFAVRYLHPDGAILDIGAGIGALLSELRAVRPDIVCTAFEPFMTIADPEIRQVTFLEVVRRDGIDVVSAFEVFEHLTPAIMDGCLAEVGRVLKRDGHFIVSVPIMEGLVLPLKEASRAILFRRRSDYSRGEMVAGIFGRQVPRAKNLLVSHKGFSHRALMARLTEDFRLVETQLSPFPKLPWWMNSQVFLVFKPA